MADMSREKAIDTLKRLKTTHMGDFGWDTTGIEALDFAIADMERVEELEGSVTSLTNQRRDLFEEIQDRDKILTDANCKIMESYKKNEELEAENKRLKEGIANVKTEIDNSRTISLTHNTALDECLNIINEYLGE